MLVLLLEWFALYFVSVPARWVDGTAFLIAFSSYFSREIQRFICLVFAVRLYHLFCLHLSWLRYIHFFRLVEWFCCRISWHRIRHLSYFVLMIIIFSIYIEYHKRLNSSKWNTSNFFSFIFFFDSTFHLNCRTKNYKCVCMCECTSQLLLDVF